MGHSFHSLIAMLNHQGSSTKWFVHEFHPLNINTAHLNTPLFSDPKCSKLVKCRRVAPLICANLTASLLDDPRTKSIDRILVGQLAVDGCGGKHAMRPEQPAPWSSTAVGPQKRCNEVVLLKRRRGSRGLDFDSKSWQPWHSKLHSALHAFDREPCNLGG